MASVTNKAVNNGGLTNKELSQSSLTFADIDDAFQDVTGPFSTPIGINNKTSHDVTITNKAING